MSALRTIRKYSALTATLLALAGTILLSVLRDHVTVALGVVGIILAICALAALGLRERRETAPLVGRFGRSAWELSLYLSPIGLLTVVFPIVSGRIGAASVDDVSLTMVVLASSLTIPWLSQATCMPLYRAIGPLVVHGDRAQVAQRFLSVWPAAFSHALPVTALFGVVVELAFRWPLEALGAYLALCLANVAFAQVLVLANIGRNRGVWALAWTAYAVTLLAAPTLYLLPPLAGTLVQLVFVRRHLPALRWPVGVSWREVQTDVVRGTLLGAVLWADKLFYFLKAGSDFPVRTVFLALLPAVFAYNFYFVQLAPGFDSAIARLRLAMENEPLADLQGHSRRVTSTVLTSIQGSGLLGAALCAAVGCWFVGADPKEAALAISVCVASWLFMMVTLLSYKIDYIGVRRIAQIIGGAHLAFCVAVFALMPPGAWLYVTALVFEALLLLVAARWCLTYWRNPHYTLFWRQATAW